MIILDTNVLSELSRDAPEVRVLGWLDEQASDSVWTTSITIYEVRFGIERMAAGQKRERLEREFHSFITVDLREPRPAFRYAFRKSRWSSWRTAPAGRASNGSSGPADSGYSRGASGDARHAKYAAFRGSRLTPLKSLDSVMGWLSLLGRKSDHFKHLVFSLRS